MLDTLNTMYGFLHNALSEMIVKGFGEEKWEHIMKEADVELGGGSFLIHKNYKDDILPRILNSAAKVLGLSQDEMVERYGEYFFKYCVECGYERLLRVLGRNLYDFLCNLDVLHDHMTSTYPGMRAPSFRCSLGDDGSMTLRYYSERTGLEKMVSGLIKAVAREFFDTKISVTLTSRRGKRQDHSVFHIREDNFTTILVRKRSNSLVSILSRAKTSTNPRDLPLGVMTFCKAFPFHLIFDRHFQIVQAGSALCRLLRTYRKQHKKLIFDKIFQVVRPVLKSLSFETILDHINTVFITVTRPGVIDKPKPSPACEDDQKIKCDPSKYILRLKGQMVFSPETDTILYLCSPRVTDVDELRERGLYLSDIPIHDATRDLILITQARRAERELVETLEETSNNLKKLQSKLQEDKRRTDELLNSLLPSAIAERLRLNQSVEAEKYNLVTILFSDIVGFTAMCGNENVVPMDIVRLLNKLYTQFDVLSNIHDVYKVETIGDAYMVVGGMPIFVETHADAVTSMAFAMMEASRTVLDPVMSEPIQIRIGVHSGPCVAGVVGQKMPRYCLFGNTVAIASSMENSSLTGRVNMSEDAKGYLTNQSQYIFEENQTRDDLPVKCYFVKLKQNAPRPVAMDLGIPLPRGMFRTPNPSPTASRNASPVDGISPASDSPLRLNSPEGALPKFKMPSIHICDADEEESFRTSLQEKVNQAAAAAMATIATETVQSPIGGPTCQSPASSDTFKSMAFQEYIFGDGHKATAPCGDLCTDSDVTVRRHSHQPVSVTQLGMDSQSQLAKSVTLSDMTDPQTTHVMIISLESPSSVSSISETDDSYSRRTSTASGIQMSSAQRVDGSGRDVGGSNVNNNNRILDCQQKQVKSNINDNGNTMCEPSVNPHSSLGCKVESASLTHTISRRRSEPAKQLDLSTVVKIDLSDEPQTEQKSQSPDPVTKLENYITSGSVDPTPSSGVREKGTELQPARKTTESKNGSVLRHEMSESNHRGNSIRGGNASPDTNLCNQRRAKKADSDSKTACNELRPPTSAAAPRPGRSRSVSSGGSDCLNETLTTTDLKRIKENGRLVIYFRGRPRSMSPSLRLHPVRVPQGSRSLRNSPFSSPQLSQKLRTLQDTGKQTEEEENFFRHVRLKRKHLLE